VAAASVAKAAVAVTAVAKAAVAVTAVAKAGEAVTAEAVEMVEAGMELADSAEEEEDSAVDLVEEGSILLHPIRGASTHLLSVRRLRQQLYLEREQIPVL